MLENIYLTVAERMGVATGLFRPVGSRPEVVAEAERLVEMVQLRDDAGRTIDELPYGRQRLVEIAIALALEPRVLLLDEPSAGVPGAETHIILDAIAALPADIAIMIIEHDMDVVFRFAERITVLGLRRRASPRARPTRSRRTSGCAPFIWATVMDRGMDKAGTWPDTGARPSRCCRSTR